MRPNKLGKTSQAAFAASSFSRWFNFAPFGFRFSHVLIITCRKWSVIFPGRVCPKIQSIDGANGGRFLHPHVCILFWYTSYSFPVSFHILLACYSNKKNGFCIRFKHILFLWNLQRNIILYEKNGNFHH